MGNKYQTNFEVLQLYDKSSITGEVTKVGILPFVVGGELPPPAIKMLFMKPRAKAKHLGTPAYQIAKGTRRIFINERWSDMREQDLEHADASFYEPLMDTALREGMEEVGLKSSNIRRLFDMGRYVFTSASRGIEKPLHMFAAEIADMEDFLPFEPTTGETRWMTPEEFEVAGRDDHVRILRELVAILGNFLLESAATSR